MIVITMHHHKLIDQNIRSFPEYVFVIQTPTQASLLHELISLQVSPFPSIFLLSPPLHISMRCSLLYIS